MSIKGSIESIYLSSMLQMLCNDGKTGILRIWDAGNEVKIYLHDGNIIYATSSRKQHRLGFLLRSKGLISADGLRQCLQLSRIKNQALGKTLVEEGLISQEDLQKFMYRKVSYTLYHAFMWQKGNFEFAEVPLNLEESLMVRLNTMELILEASRRADERSIRNIKAPTEVPGTPEEEKTINLLPSDKE
jgi:hypothetical protein